MEIAEEGGIIEVEESVLSWKRKQEVSMLIVVHWADRNVLPSNIFSVGCIEVAMF